MVLQGIFLDHCGPWALLSCVRTFQCGLATTERDLIASLCQWRQILFFKETILSYSTRPGSSSIAFAASSLLGWIGTWCDTLTSSLKHRSWRGFELRLYLFWTVYSNRASNTLTARSSKWFGIYLSVEAAFLRTFCCYDTNAEGFGIWRVNGDVPSGPGELQCSWWPIMSLPKRETLFRDESSFFPPEAWIFTFDRLLIWRCSACASTPTFSPAKAMHIFSCFSSLRGN